VLATLTCTRNTRVHSNPTDHRIAILRDEGERRQPRPDAPDSPDSPDLVVSIACCSVGQWCGCTLLPRALAIRIERQRTRARNKAASACGFRQGRGSQRESTRAGHPHTRSSYICGSSRNTHQHTHTQGIHSRTPLPAHPYP
jgi:hypothetical protein